MSVELEQRAANLRRASEWLERPELHGSDLEDGFVLLQVSRLTSSSRSFHRHRQIYHGIRHRKHMKKAFPVGHSQIWLPLSRVLVSEPSSSHFVKTPNTPLNPNGMNSVVNL
jgi:hypothetical protein